VLVHGGFWRARYGLDLERDLAADLVGREWTVWNIEYRRLCDGGGWPDTYDDVRAAIAALPVPAERVVAIGHSAGGHLAVRAAADVPLTGVVSQAGALDLVELWRRGTSDHVVQKFLGGSPDAVPDRYDAAAPRPPGVPLLLVHGALDEDVPVEISRSYGAGELVVIEDEGHMEHLDPASRCWRAVTEWL
jgi:pimeloyl-ACP methyl ester carboxylesterase